MWKTPPAVATYSDILSAIIFLAPLSGLEDLILMLSCFLSAVTAFFESIIEIILFYFDEVNYQGGEKQ